MARTVINLGDTQVIKDLLALYANHNSRIIPLETLYAALLNRLEAVEDLLGGVTPTPGPSPTLSLSSAVGQPEGDTGTTAFVWTLTLTRDGSTAAYPFMWAVAGNGSSPAEASDFGGSYPVGSGMFAAGETVKTITVLATGDTAVEPAETFTLTVTASGLNTVSSIGTISNDDPVTTPVDPASIILMWSAMQ